jgi:Kae1-associated kinase Bud32
MKIIARGAEAVIYENGDEIIKYREKKGYRIQEIDIPLRKARTKIEFTILKKCLQVRLNTPKPIKISKEGDKLYMGKIDGVQLDYSFSIDKTNKVGEMLARLHKIGVIHGDLTTANILVKENEIFFIDFGLSHFSRKDEDRATDLFLFKNALKSRHPKEFADAYPSFLSSYEEAMGKEFKGVGAHLKDIERRGRYHEDS